MFDAYGVLHLGMLKLGGGKAVASCLLHYLDGSIYANLRIVGHESEVEGEGVLFGGDIEAACATACRHHPGLCLVR